MESDLRQPGPALKEEIIKYLQELACLVHLLPGHWTFLAIFLAGFFGMATMPLTLTMAQELAPPGKSMASSLFMGLAFGTGGMMTPLTGKLADLFSLRPVLSILALIPLLAYGLIYFFPEKKWDSPPSGI